VFRAPLNVTIFTIKIIIVCVCVCVCVTLCVHCIVPKCAWEPGSIRSNWGANGFSGTLTGLWEGPGKVENGK